MFFMPFHVGFTCMMFGTLRFIVWISAEHHKFCCISSSAWTEQRSVNAQKSSRPEVSAFLFNFTFSNPKKVHAGFLHTGEINNSSMDLERQNYLGPPWRPNFRRSCEGYGRYDFPVCFQDLGIYRRLGDPELDFALGRWWYIVLRSLWILFLLRMGSLCSILDQLYLSRILCALFAHPHNEVGQVNALPTPDRTRSCRNPRCGGPLSEIPPVLLGIP